MKKLITALGLSLCLASCAGGPQPGTPQGKCLFNPKGAAKVMVEYKGEKVGFCCKKCEKKWNAMSEADKDAKLASR